MLTSQTHSARGWELSAGCSGKCSCSIPEACGQVLRMAPAQEQAVPMKPVLVLFWFCKFRGKGNSEFGGSDGMSKDNRRQNWECWIKLGSFKVPLVFLPYSQSDEDKTFPLQLAFA